MNPRHHPSNDILAAYAAGALEPGFGLVLGAHLEACPVCRAHVAGLETCSGASLATLPEAEIAPDALARVMARLDTQDHAARDDRPFLERLPLKQRKWAAPGIWVAPVDTPHDPKNRVYVLSAAPGARAALHEHAGEEFCAVLKGGYRDKFGLFTAGDFAAADGSAQHEPIVDGDDACVCLFATEGRLRPHGLVGKIAFLLGDV